MLHYAGPGFCLRCLGSWGSDLGLLYPSKFGETNGRKSEEIWRTVKDLDAPLTRKEEIEKTQLEVFKSGTGQS